jgi:hypothetical protein
VFFDDFRIYLVGSDLVGQGGWSADNADDSLVIDSFGAGAHVATVGPGTGTQYAAKQVPGLAGLDVSRDWSVTFQVVISAGTTDLFLGIGDVDGNVTQYCLLTVSSSTTALETNADFSPVGAIAFGVPVELVLNWHAGTNMVELLIDGVPAATAALSALDVGVKPVVIRYTDAVAGNGVLSVLVTQL